MFPCGVRTVTGPSFPEARRAMLEGAGCPEAPDGLGHRGCRAAATLTSAGSSIHEGAITLVVEEEVGPVLVITEDI